MGAPQGSFPSGRWVALPELRVWATCLAAALTHRARLSADDVRAFTLPYDEIVPRLPGLINEPVPAATL